jgi:hypothetical protein
MMEVRGGIKVGNCQGNGLHLGGAPLLFGGRVGLRCGALDNGPAFEGLVPV